jgi:GNAT superfamily N-acetyltransferase
MPYKIRLIDHKELKWRLVLKSLQKECLPGDTVYAPTNGYWHLAFGPDMVPVGFSGLVPSQRWCDCMYLCRAGVLPAHRGQGLQKRLIRARVQVAKEQGMNWLVTDTNDNPASGNSLIACGFKLFEPTVPWAAKGAIYWRMKL